jgi:hypothetical protein
MGGKGAEQVEKGREGQRKKWNFWLVDCMGKMMKFSPLYLHGSAR